LGAALFFIGFVWLGRAAAQSTIQDLSSKPAPPKPPATVTGAPTAPLPSPRVQPSPAPRVQLITVAAPSPAPSLAPSPSPHAVELIGAPATTGSPLRQVPVPKGQSLESVKVPGIATTTVGGYGQVITAIAIKGNVKTDSNTIEYLAGVKIGDVLSEELVYNAKIRLQSSGLFREVEITWDGSPLGGARLQILAQDKQSWVIAPIAFASDGNYGGGLIFAHGNLFGQNKKLLVYADYTTTEKLLFVALLDPNIRNSRFYYRADLLIRRDTIREYGAGYPGEPRLSRESDLDTFGAAILGGVNFTRHFHLDLRLKIYYDLAHPAYCYNTTNQDRSGTPDVVAWQGGVCRAPTGSAWDNTLTTSIAFDNRSRVNGIFDGILLALTWQYGPSWLGTGNDYHLVSFNGMYAKRFFKEHNLILRASFDVFVDPPFKMEVEAGGPQMRGFIVRQYRGDTAARATLEYIVPLFTIWGLSFRAIAFYDTNLTWFRDLPAQSSATARLVQRGNNFRDFLPDTPSGVVRDSWHNGIGGGLRFYLRGVVLPLLGLDFAYGFESNAFQWYVNIGSTID
jgi:outer membrane protein insertion porin family